MISATDSPLTIAVVCYPGLGGSGIVATELAVELARRGHGVHVLASAPPSRALPECASLFFHEVSAPSYPLFVDAPYTLALAGSIVSLGHELSLDVLHVHYAVPHAASAYLARMTLGPRAPKVVTTLHGTDVTRIGSDPSYREVTRFCVQASDAITVPSRYLASEAQSTLGIDPRSPIDVLPNFVDSDRFCPAPARAPDHFDALFAAQGCPPCATRGPTLFHVSSFRAVKRVTDLLEVLARVRERIPARLVLVGDGPDRTLAQQRARELGLGGCVCFLGKRAEFVEHLRHADAFLLTSETESFGLAALEALSCSVPVIGYAVGGVPEVVTEDVGRLVPPFDLDAFAAAVLEVVGDPARHAVLAAAARARVLASYQCEPSVQRYEALFRRVLAAGKETEDRR